MLIIANLFVGYHMSGDCLLISIYFAVSNVRVSLFFFAEKLPNNVAQTAEIESQIHADMEEKLYFFFARSIKQQQLCIVLYRI